MPKDTGLSVKMRVFWLPNGEPVEQYRVCRENGFGGAWEATVYLAWVDWRRKARAA